MALRPALLFALLLVGAWLAVVPAHAAGAMVGQPLDVCIARAAPGLTSAQVLAHPERADCTTPQAELGAGDFWAVSTPLPASVEGGTPLGVRVAGMWQRSITLFALYPDGEIVRRVLPDAGAGHAVQLGGVIQQRLPERDQAPVRLAWRIDGAANTRGILIGPHVASPQEIARANTTMAAIYSACAGLAIALLIHNLMMWHALRQRVQLWYVGLLVCILGYAFSTSGALAWAWPDLPNTMRLRFNLIALALSGVASIGFARNFFEPRVFAGAVGRAAHLVSAMLFGAAVLFAAAAPWRIGLLDGLYNIAFSLAAALAIPIGWRAWQVRSVYLLPYAMTWVAPLAITGLRLSHNFGLIGWNFWVDNSAFLASAATALGTSLAIAWRVRQIAHERDDARARELAAQLLADVDPLTGLLNRRAFLSRAIGRSGRQALLLIDLDRFKSINDTIGHDGGDEVLRRVAAVLRAVSPAGALTARLGGEEFALLCDADAAPAAETLLAALRESRMPYDLRVTASVGTCVAPLAHERDWKALYQAADRALYAAKNAGRDRAQAGRLTALAA